MSQSEYYSILGNGIARPMAIAVTCLVFWVAVVVMDRLVVPALIANGLD